MYPMRDNHEGTWSSGDKGEDTCEQGLSRMPPREKNCHELIGWAGKYTSDD